MRAPSYSAYFEIPYSGTLEIGDCILIAAGAGDVDIVARYNVSAWVYEDNMTHFSDENNVISFRTSKILSGGSAALIPGPNHV